MGNCKLSYCGPALPCSPEAAAALAAQWHDDEDEGLPPFGQGAQNTVIPGVYRWDQHPPDWAQRSKYAPVPNQTFIPERLAPTPPGEEQVGQETAKRTAGGCCSTVLMVLGFLLFAGLCIVVFALPVILGAGTTTTTTSTFTSTKTSTSTTLTTTTPESTSTATPLATTSTSTDTTRETTTTAAPTTTVATTKTTTAGTTGIMTSTERISFDSSSTPLQTSTSRKGSHPSASPSEASRASTSSQDPKAAHSSQSQTGEELVRRLHVSLKVQHLDYGALVADTRLLKTFKHTVQEAIAAHAGDIDPRGILLSLRPGSVRVAAQLPSLSQEATETAFARLKSSKDFSTGLAASIGKMPGVEKALTGPAEVIDTHVAVLIYQGGARDWLLPVLVTLLALGSCLIAAVAYFCRPQTDKASAAERSAAELRGAEASEPEDLPREGTLPVHPGPDMRTVRMSGITSTSPLSSGRRALTAWPPGAISPRVAAVAHSMSSQSRGSSRGSSIRALVPSAGGALGPGALGQASPFGASLGLTVASSLSGSGDAPTTVGPGPQQPQRIAPSASAPVPDVASTEMSFSSIDTPGSMESSRPGRGPE